MAGKGFKSDNRDKLEAMTLADVTRWMKSDLEASGIKSPAHQKGMQVQPYTADQMVKVIGHAVPGYELPYFEPSGKKNCFSRFKFVEPLVVNERDIKYYQPPGSPVRLYLPTSQDWQKIFSDPSIPIGITEGEKKAACACINGFPVIGLGGVWSFSAHGNLIDEFYFPEDIIWLARAAYFAFDSPDILDPNKNVAEAMRRLEAALCNLGAITHIKILPVVKGLDKVGLDDFIVKKGKDAFAKLPMERLDQRKFDNLGINPAIPRLNRRMAFLENGGRSPIAVITDDKQISLQAVQTMRDEYRSQKIKVDDEKVNPFTLWLDSYNRRNAKGIIMNPDSSFGFDPATRELNLWQGFAYEPVKPGKAYQWTLLQEHIRQVLASGDKAVSEYIFNWMAFGVQRPASRADVAIVLRGGQGTGKGMAVRHYGALFGPHFLHIMSKDQLVGRFNSEYANKVLVFADEAFFAGDKAAASKLKAMITEPTMTIEGKFQNPYTLPNHRKFLMASNEHWVVPADADSRRFAVFDVSDVRRNDTKYFGQLIEQMKSGGYEAMLYDLLNRDISKFVVWEYPKTNALLDQKLLSLDLITNWWFKVLCAGTFGIDSDGKWEGECSTKVVQNQIAESATSKYDDLRSLETRIGMTLSQLSSSSSKQRRIRENKVTQRKERGHYYVFKDLSTCRKEFEKYSGMVIDWETGRLK